MKPSIFFWIKDWGGSGYYRIYLPYVVLNKYFAFKYETVLNMQPKFGYNSDIMVIQGPYEEPKLEILKDAKKMGKKVIVEYDDDLFHLSPSNPAFEYVEYRTRNVETALKMADAVVVATDTLKEAYSRFTDKIFTINNYVDEAVFNIPKKKNEDGLIIGWQGSAARYEDLKKIKSVINGLSKKRKFKFALAGYDPGFFNNSVYRGSVPVDPGLEFFKLFQDYDIGVCPIEKNRFNECKSDLKFIEYGSLGIPAVASRNVAYSTIVEGETGYTAGTAAKWEEKLTLLLDNADERERIGNNAKEYVASERTIRKNIWRWEEVINFVMS